MRADRLLALLMLLQTRGRMTARELAEELEVSQRTIYRDIDALSAAGVPVYGEPGREGGYALLDSYRTHLTGLSEGEVRALSMLNTPAPLVQLGLHQALRSALLKLSAALSDIHRADEQRVRQRFHLDSAWWHQDPALVPQLPTVHQAVWQDRRLQISYRIGLGIEIEQVVDPYGLVAKAGVWYLLSARKGSIRVVRVSELMDARMLDEPFERPADFDLAASWQAWCAGRESGHSAYPVTVRVSPALLPHLPAHFGARIRDTIARAGPPDGDGWVTLDLSFASLEAARETGSSALAERSKC